MFASVGGVGGGVDVICSGGIAVCNCCGSSGNVGRLELSLGLSWFGGISFSVH